MDDDERKKPEKFANYHHERRWEHEEHKRKIIIKFSADDFKHQQVEGYNKAMTKDYNLKNPVTHVAWLAGI